MMEKEQLLSLVQKAQQGDNDALNELFQSFYNDVYYFALKTVKNEDLAPDITQETFIEIFNTIGNLKEPVAFVTWMKQITYHQCTRYFKKKKDILVDEDEDGNTIFDTLKEDRAEFIPDVAMDKQDFKQTILAMIDDLKEEQRTVVMLYYFDEMSYSEIEQITGMSQTDIKNKLFASRKAIKNKVEDYEKKHNIKLHAIPFFPFFKWLFEGLAEQSAMPIATAEAVAEGVGAATGVTVSAGATATASAVASGATVATVAPEAATTGIVAKIAALPIVTKILAGVVAGAIAIGGVTTAVVLNNNGDSSQTDTNAQSYKNVDEYFDNWTEKEAIERYAGWAMGFDMPYFNSPGELSEDVAARFTFGAWAGWYDGKLETEMGLGEIERYAYILFGKEFDLTKVTGNLASYNSETDMVNINLDNTKTPEASSRDMYFKMVDNKDGTYSKTIALFDEELPSKPDDFGKVNNTYVFEEDTGKYYKLSSISKATIKKINGFWAFVSFTKETTLPNEDDDSAVNEGSSDTTADTKPNNPVKLPFDEEFYGGNALALPNKGVNGLTAERILNRSSYEIFHGYIYDNMYKVEMKKWEYFIDGVTKLFPQYAVPEDIVYSKASMFFVIDETTKNMLRQSDRYDSNNKAYWVCDPSPFFTGIDATTVGYEDLGNDEFVLYVQARETNHLSPCGECGPTNSCVISTPLFKTKIKTTENNNYVICSFDYIDAIPTNIEKIN